MRAYDFNEIDALTRENLGLSFDIEVAAQAVKATVEALRKQAQALEKEDYSVERKCPHCKKMISFPIHPKDLAQMMAYTAKTADELARLIEFSRGRPDSRPDIGLQSIFGALTEEQINQVQEWVEGNRSIEIKPQNEEMSRNEH